MRKKREAVGHYPTQNMNEKKERSSVFFRLNFAISGQRNWENFANLYFSSVNFTIFSFFGVKFCQNFEIKKI